MTIPNSVKIGGKVYEVERTNNLYNGAGYSAEIDYNDLQIRIRPNARGKMESDFIHEVMHGIHDFLGYTEHDEKKIDELANALHMVIADNPGVFATADQEH